MIKEIVVEVIGTIIRTGITEPGESTKFNSKYRSNRNRIKMGRARQIMEEQ